jgi:chromate reductase, NAD(P)H dehydrogenase (quinone)
MKLIAISGSLRSASLNTSVLHAARNLAPAGVEIELFEGIGQLPFFNSDLEAGSLTEEVARYRAVIGAADGLLISSPEYARGVSGVMKNALDWLVGSEQIPGKPVALINTSPRATHALAALTITLETMSVHLVSDASLTLPLLGTAHDADSIAADPELAGPLRDALQRFVAAIRAPPGRLNPALLPSRA